MQGTPWSKGKTITMSREKLVSNILCNHHNNSLSSYIDPEGIKAFNIILEIERIQSNVKKDDPTNRFSYNLNGNFLERWFMKTAINFYVAYHKDNFGLTDLYILNVH